MATPNDGSGELHLALAKDAEHRPPRPLRRGPRGDLRSMLADGVAFGAMVGLGESCLPAFALELGHGSVTAGLIATLPMLVGALLQLVSPAAVGLLHSHRR